MNALKSVFEQKRAILSIYFTAGYPNLKSTAEIIESLEEAGADIIEVGIPYSDPIADGPTIQKSSSIALKNGMNLKLVFDQLNEIKTKINTPLVLMGYFNQLLVYGPERFLSSCKEAGIQALIIPDLPIETYKLKYLKLFKKYGLSHIFLVTPQTSEDRIRMIDELSDGFIYLVSSSSITGARKEINENQISYFKRIKILNLRNPCLIGFGISNHQTFKTACEYSSGAIIGSAFIKAISGNGNLKKTIKDFIKSIKQ